MVTKRIAGIAGLLVALGTGDGGASPHLGWCIGVGNPHQSAYCGDGTRPHVDNPVAVQPPSGTQGPTVGPGTATPQNPPTTQIPQAPQQPVPQTIVLPVLPGAQIPPTGPGQGPVIQPPGPFEPVSITVPTSTGPTVTTVTPGGGPQQLPPIVVSMPSEPRPIPPGGGTVPTVTAIAVPPLTYVSHQITVGTVNVPQIVINATGPGAQAIPGQIYLTPIAIPVPRPPAGTVAPPRPPALVPTLPGNPPGPQGTPTPQVPGALLVPVLVPPLPARPDPVPQGTPTPNLPPQVLVPVLVPPQPSKPNAIPQATPNPLTPALQQPPPLRPPVILRPQPPQVIATIVFPRPKPRPVLVPPTTILQPIVTHSTTVTRPPLGTGQVTAQPGRQPGGAHPAFTDPSGSGNWNCVASGVGARQVLKGGRIVTTGVQRHVGNVDALGRDVPAKHPKHPHCIISVQRRDGD